MKIERLQMSIQTVKENIAILESQEPEDAGHYLQLEHEKMVLEALEKQIPIKPVYNCTRRALCPICDAELYPKFLYVRRFKHQEIRIEEKTPYCKHCGQALDWGKESEDTE